jgi:hypothetical protein
MKVGSFLKALPVALVATIFTATTAIGQNTPARLEFRSTKGAVPNRPAIRAFAQDVQRELHYSLGFPFPAEGAPDIVFEIGYARPFAFSAGHRLFRLPNGKIKAAVIVPDPAVPDLGQFRFAIVAAIFRAELHSRVARGTRPGEPPEWFVRGLAALTDPNNRGNLFEQAYGQWSHARLDAAQWLFRADSRTATLPAVASQLAAWCAERSSRRERWSKLLDSLAKGDQWSPALLARVFADSENPSALDDSFDAWMASRDRRVFSPGTTSGGTLSRMRLALIAFPSELGFDPDSGFDGKAYLPLSWYAQNPGLPGVSKLLLERASAFRRSAIGRDTEFQQLCSLYADALETSARKGWFYASAYWLAAEDLRADLEARVAAGETLGAGKR